MEPTVNPYKKTGNASREARMQSECVTWYRCIWYQNRRGLWATNNEGKDVGKKLAMGMLSGVSDLCLKDARGLGGIEMKYPGESHEVAHVINQAEWIIETCDFGGFVDGFEQFKRIVQGESAWIDPHKVKAYLLTLTKKTFIWDSSRF